MDVHADPTRSEQRAADRRTALELLDRVLACMDQELVLVFVLYEVEGLSTPELAELLDVPLGTAASRLRRARQAFREAAGSLDVRLPEVSP
jgi:RNA polymerase sigma-70 factor (ECF subfamily)